MIQREDESSKTPAPQKTEWEMWLQAVTCIESFNEAQFSWHTRIKDHKPHGLKNVNSIS